MTSPRRPPDGRGLDLYDALTHTFSTLSTGGFSPRNESIAAFASPSVHLSSSSS
jgi:Trk-type K+ transport system membrane component